MQSKHGAQIYNIKVIFKKRTAIIYHNWVHILFLRLEEKVRIVIGNMLEEHIRNLGNVVHNLLGTWWERIENNNKNPTPPTLPHMYIQLVCKFSMKLASKLEICLFLDLSLVTRCGFSIFLKEWLVGKDDLRIGIRGNEIPYDFCFGEMGTGNFGGVHKRTIRCLTCFLQIVI